MKRIAYLAVAAALFAPAVAPAALEPVAPAEGAVAPLLSAGQKAYLSMPRAERVAYFASQSKRNEMVKLGYWPQPVRLEWKGGKPGAEYAVSVKRMPDGKEFFSFRGTNTCVEVDNLEIARNYEWTVSGSGEKFAARFSTEDFAPRLMRIPGVPNVRDLGGRIGLDGRRVKQGMVYRSAGLNDNAGTKRVPLDSKLVTQEDLRRVREKRADIEAHIARYKAYQADPKTFPRSHKGWQAWARRNKNGTVADYFRFRIKQDERELDRLSKGVKISVPGKNRLDDAAKAYVVDTLGVKSDIDLRTDGECYGMTGSPAGERVKWFHYSSSAYEGMQAAGGKKAFAKVFRVFLDEKNYPIDFHCIAGQDRTGAVAFILNGLLGVAEEDLYLDWETTGFWNKSARFSHARCFNKLVDGFRTKVPGANLHEKIRNYVLSLGFTEADIEKFRSIMLEPAPAR